MHYQTRKRELLTEALEEHIDEMMTAEQIIGLVPPGEMSRSAVYRNLSMLEKDGRIMRIVTPGQNKVLFRYTGSARCRGCLHLECSVCGRICHLEAPATNLLVSNIMREARFSVDRVNTILSGTCEKCAEKICKAKQVNS